MGNKMSGDIPVLPSTINDLMLGQSGSLGNRFSGTLRLNQPLNVNIYDNWISDVIIQDSTKLTSCELSNNPLLGDLNIAALTICTKTGLYYASSLPNTLTTKQLTSSTVPPTKVKTAAALLYTTQIAMTIPAIATSVNTVSAAISSSSVIVNTKSTFKIIPNLSFTSSNTVSSKYDSTTEEAIATEITQYFHTTMTSPTSPIAAQFVFVPFYSEFSINIRMVLRVFISVAVFGYVILTTPLAVGFKRMLKSRKQSNTKNLTSFF